MKHSLLSLVLLLGWIAGYQGASAQLLPGNLQSCAGRFVPGKDYFPDKVRPRHAGGFAVEYRGNYKLVQVKTPWPGATRPLEYVLVQCGTPVPVGFRPDQVITVPVQSVATLSTTHLPLLEILGLMDRVVAVADVPLIYGSEALERVRSGKAVDVGTEVNVNIERLLAARPAMVSAFAIGERSDSYPVLKSAGLKVVLNAEYLETSPLGRTEWLKYMALFFNREKTANQRFSGIEQRYRALVQTARRAAVKPTVCTGAATGGIWYIAGGRSYLARLLSDGGARYAWSDNPDRGGVPKSFEQVYERCREADFWVNGGQNWQQLADVGAEDSRYRKFRAVGTGSVYNNNSRLSASGANDYWQGGLVRPDRLLADLVGIFHPELLPEHRLVYYRPLK